MRWLDSIPDSINMNLNKPWETLKEKGAWRAAVHWGHKESDKTPRLNSKELRDLCKLRTLWEGSRAPSPRSLVHGLNSSFKLHFPAAAEFCRPCSPSTTSCSFSVLHHPCGFSVPKQQFSKGTRMES